MRSLTRFLALAWLVLAASAWAAAPSAANEAFEAGRAAFAQQAYRLALRHFQEARDSGLGGPAIHYNIGVCHYKLADYRQAESAFRVVADGYPAMRALAQYNLGLVALRQNRDSEARTYFELARLRSTDEKVTRLAENMLQRQETAPEPKSWFGMVNARLGHDDNVSLIADIGLPVGGSAASNFSEFFGTVSGPFSASPGLRFDGSLYSVRYSDAGTFDQNALRLGGVYQWRWGAWRVEAGPYLNYSTLNGDGFEQRLGVGLSLKRSVTNQTILSIRVDHDEIEDIEPQFAFVEGSRDQLRLALNRRSSRSSAVLGVVWELNDRIDPSVSPTRNRIFARYRFSVNSEWLVDLEWSLRVSTYDDLVPEREEDLTELTLGLVRNLSGGWQITGAYHWSENDSNENNFSYDRTRTMLSLNKMF